MGAGIETALLAPPPPPLSVLAADPLEAIRRDHLRQRAMLRALERIAAAPSAPDPAEAAVLFGHLAREAPLHHRDEDDDLLPLLRRRATAEDNVEALFARLGRDHEASARRACEICPALVRLAEGGPPLDAADRAGLAAHASAEFRHLTLENAVMLPLARARLGARDLRTLALRMAARRGICLVPETDPC